MKASEAHDLKDDELVAKLNDAQQEAFNLRFRHATGELENTARMGVAKSGRRSPADDRPGARHRHPEGTGSLKMSEEEEKTEETTEEPQAEAPASGGRRCPCRATRGRAGESPSPKHRNPSLPRSPPTTPGSQS